MHEFANLFHNGALEAYLSKAMVKGYPGKARKGPTQLGKTLSLYLRHNRDVLIDKNGCADLTYLLAISH